MTPLQGHSTTALPDSSAIVRGSAQVVRGTDHLSRTEQIEQDAMDRIERAAAACRAADAELEAAIHDGRRERLSLRMIARAAGWRSHSTVHEFLSRRRPGA